MSDCLRCRGTGLCPNCGGDAIALSGNRCQLCDGIGDCPGCDGDGRFHSAVTFASVASAIRSNNPNPSTTSGLFVGCGLIVLVPIGIGLLLFALSKSLTPVIVRAEHDIPKAIDPIKREAIVHFLKLGASIQLSNGGDDVWSVWLPGSKTVTNDDLKRLQVFQNLENIVLLKTDISDEGLAHLRQLSKLKHVNLIDTKCTKDGIQKFKDAFPNCYFPR